MNDEYLYMMDFSNFTFEPLVQPKWNISLDELITNNGGYATEQNTYCDVKVVSWN